MFHNGDCLSQVAEKVS